MKKLISIILALVMALSLCVTTVWADDVTVVNSYDELKTAIETTKVPYIKLGADIVIDPSAVPFVTPEAKSHQRITVTHELTLDLNGHKISYGGAAYTPTKADEQFDVFVLKTGAKMTVTGNGTIDASIVVDETYKTANPSVAMYTFCFRLFSNSKAELTIQNGTYVINVPAKQTDETNPNVILVYNDGGVVTINGGRFEVKGGAGIALNVAGSGQAEFKQINVNNGTIVGSFRTGDSKPADGAPIANNSDNTKHYIGGNAIADAVNNNESVTVTTGGEINGVKGGSITVASGVTGVKINGVEVAGEAANDLTTINVRKVTFLDGETVLSEVGVVDGQKVEKPADPTKDGYIFVRWNLNGEEYDFNAAVSSNLTLTAQWEAAPAPAPDQAPINRQNTAVTTPAAKTDDTDKTDVVTSAKTFDAGVAVYGAMAVASLLGMGYVGKKRV